MASLEQAAPEKAQGKVIDARTARLAVTAIFFINGMLVANWFARIPDVKLALGLREGPLSIALLCSAVGALIAQPTAGVVIGRLGSRAVTTAMALSFCIAFILPGFATSLPLLMLALFFFGATNGALDVAMNAQAALVEHRYRRSIMNTFHGFWSVGGLLGAAVGGLAAARGLTVSTHFILAAAVGVIAMFVASRSLIPDRPVPGAAAGSEGHAPAFALPTKALIPMGIVALCALITEGAIGDWGAIYLREGLGSSAAVAAFGYSIFALLMAGGRFTGDWLTTRFGSGHIVRAGGGLVIIGIGLVLAILSGFTQVNLNYISDNKMEVLTSVNLEIEPTFLTIGPAHMATGINNYVYLHKFFENGAFFEKLELVKKGDYFSMVSDVGISDTHLAVLTENKLFLEAFWNSKTIDDVFLKSDQYPLSTVASVFKSGFKEFKKIPNPDAAGDAVAAKVVVSRNATAARDRVVVRWRMVGSLIVGPSAPVTSGWVSNHPL